MFINSSDRNWINRKERLKSVHLANWYSTRTASRNYLRVLVVLVSRKRRWSKVPMMESIMSIANWIYLEEKENPVVDFLLVYSPKWYQESLRFSETRSQEALITLFWWVHYLTLPSETSSVGLLFFVLNQWNGDLLYTWCFFKVLYLSPLISYSCTGV